MEECAGETESFSASAQKYYTQDDKKSYTKRIGFDGVMSNDCLRVVIY